MQLLNIVLPIFLIILAGFVLRRINILKSAWVHALNSYVYYIALPALVLLSFWNINWLDSEVQKILVFNIVILIILSILLLIGLKFIPISQKDRAAVFLTIMVGNTIYMGFPLIGKTVAAEHYKLVVAAATVHLVLGMAFSILTVEFLVQKSKNWKKYAADFFINPLVLALFAGIGLSLLNASGPLAEFFKSPLSALSVTASPVALFALGGFLHGRFMSGHLKTAGLASAFKLLALPLLIWLGGIIFKIKQPALDISVLVSAMPSAVTCFVISERYKLDEKLVANAILLSTAASVITISSLLTAAI
ncbi:MAG: AEC family transporter [Candidatus Doudnabacteria bacterium]|nr:AEC family transporter [Candidatus Doudnabacteria bacterium]